MHVSQMSLMQRFHSYHLFQIIEVESKDDNSDEAIIIDQQGSPEPAHGKDSHDHGCNQGFATQLEGGHGVRPPLGSRR